MKQARSMADVRAAIFSMIAAAVLTLAFLVTPGTPAAVARINVTTYHYDNKRTGWNHAETTLKTANVSGSSFMLLHQVTVDQEIQGQPLIFNGIVYVVTANNTVYAIGATTGNILMHRNLGTPIPGRAVPIGINSTPTIDAKMGLMYLIAYTLESGKPVYRLHALNLKNLDDAVPAVVVTGQHRLKDGTVYEFDPVYERQRPALLRANGNIYAAFGSFGDHNVNLTRGWVIAWDAATLALVSTNYLTNRLAASAQDDFFLTAIWMSGAGPATDDAGSVYFVTSNSDKFEPTWTSAGNLAESVVKIGPTLAPVLGYFTPGNAQFLDAHDMDFGAGGIMLLPGQAGFPTHHLAVAAGKDGAMYLLDRDALGGYNPPGVGASVHGSYPIGPCWCTESYFVGPDHIGRIVASGGSTVTTWKVQNSPTAGLVKDHESPALSTGGDPGFFTSVSSFDTAPGTAIVWAVSRAPVSATDLTMRLYAFDAITLQQLFSAPAGSWLSGGGNSNAVPVVANGKAYVASNQSLAIFGLSPSPTAQASPFVAAASEPATAASSSAHHIFGTVMAIKGEIIVLQTRSGAIEVDPRKDKNDYLGGAPVIGQGLEVTGDYNVAGIFQADAMMRADAAPASWAADR